MAKILISGGRLLDPALGLNKLADVLIVDGKIVNVGKVKESAETTIDATGKLVCPGLIDMHVHLREPGDDEAETIASGSAAAIAGGFATVVAMANTDPPVDSAPAAEYVRLQAARAGLANVLPVGCITKGRQGAELSEMGALARAGCVGFSDDGSPVMNSEVMRRAMEYARMLDKPILSHAEEKNLSGAGCMNEGAVSTRLGLAGIPTQSELVAVMRDVVLAEMTGARLHVQHVSTAGAVEVIRAAKARGARVTCEVAAHHFTLADGCLLERDNDGILKFDTNHKMNPPLRTQRDVEALKQGLCDGTIDCIVSDHAPHTLTAKEIEFADAPFGIVGLETTLGLVVSELIAPGLLSWKAAVAAMTCNPAKVLGIPKGTLAVGADGDVTVIDPDVAWAVDVNAFKSKSRNSPFGGRRLRGKATHVIVGGELKS